MAQERMWVYQDTLDQIYPVVLIFGREGNNSGDMNDVIGRYDFSLSPNSAFWNRAYGFVARVCGLSTAAILKKQCDARRGSPIAFANCSPFLISNSISKKNSLRSGQESQLEAHIQRVFQLSDRELTGRLKAVVLSAGTDFALYDTALRLISAQTRARQLPLIDAPYFGSRQPNEVLDSQVGSRHQHLLAALVGDFLDIEHPKPGAPPVR